MSRQDKATTEKNSRTLRELVKRTENKVCADCKRNDPRWASWNLGVFLCIRCSGVHRGMGTHISKVKSVDLDVWTPEQMESIQKWGNRRANLYWEAHLKPGHMPAEHKMESFIRSKYESHRWAMESPPPADPSILEQSTSPDDRHDIRDLQQQSQASTPPAGPFHKALSSVTVNHPVLSNTAQQSRSHQLLSANFISPNSTQSNPASGTTSGNATEDRKSSAPANNNDLFSLDFHAPAISIVQSNTATASGQPKKDVKQDILSLFSTPTPIAPAPNSSTNQLSTSSWASATTNVQPLPTSMIGENGVGAWGVSSGWAGPTGTQQVSWSNPGSTPHASGLFNTSDIWNAPSSLYNQPTQNTSSTTERKDDVFGDLWGQ